MKKSVLNVIVALTAVFSVSVVNAQSTPEFLYNTCIENGKVVSKQVCRLDPSGNVHKLHLKYEYSYNVKGVIQSCKTLHWNKRTASWENTSIKTFEYNNLQKTVTIYYALWNKKENVFDEPQQKAVYQYFDEEHLVNYTQYRKDILNNDWQINTYFDKNNYLISQINE